MSSIHETMRCSQCKLYLSILPVKVYADRSVKCGRCYTKDDGGTVSLLYESLAENMQFPCINWLEGCQQMLKPSGMKAHESGCCVTIMDCPICSKYSGLSLTVVEHIKRCHSNNLLYVPAFVLPTDRGDYHEIYVYINFREKILATLDIFYDSMLQKFSCDVKLINPHPELRQIFELHTVEKGVIYNSGSLPLYPDSIFTDLKQEHSPEGVVMCKFSIGFLENLNVSLKEMGTIGDTCTQQRKLQIKEVVKEVLIPCKKNHFPLDPVVIQKPCSLDHVRDNPVMDVHDEDSGEMYINFVVKNIRSLTKQTFPAFYLANTKWKLSFSREYFEDVLYLACYLEKVGQFSKRSYKVNFDVTVLSSDEYYNVKVEPPKNHILYGTRKNEYTSYGVIDVINWSQLLDPNMEFTFTDGKDDTDMIQVQLRMEIVEIFKHRYQCSCSGCKEQL